MHPAQQQADRQARARAAQQTVRRQLIGVNMAGEPNLNYSSMI